MIDVPTQTERPVVMWLDWCVFVLMLGVFLYNAYGRFVLGDHSKGVTGSVIGGGAILCVVAFALAQNGAQRKWLRIGAAVMYALYLVYFMNRIFQR